MDVTVERLSKEEIVSSWPKFERLLAHKPFIGFDLFRRAGEGELGCAIESFIAVVGEKWIGNVTLFHEHGVGLVGNVFIRDEYRGLGIGRVLMHAVDEFGRINDHSHHVLWVDPNKRQIAFELYKKMGYWNSGENGIMIHFLSDENPFESTSKLTLEPLNWSHYPVLNLLTSLGHCGVMGSYLHPCYGAATFETEFYLTMTGDEYSWAFLNEKGVPVGALFIRRNSLWDQQRELGYDNGNYLADILLHEEYGRLAREALQAFTFPAGNFLAYAAKVDNKFGLLEACFDHQRTLEGQFVWRDKAYDVGEFSLANH